MSGLRSQRGATWVVNSAMPRLTGTAITTAIVDVISRAVDERQRAVHSSVRRPPLLGEELEAHLVERRPRCASS